MIGVDVQIHPVREDEQSILRHLIDLYVYDFSEILGIDIRDDGRFDFPDLAPYWKDQGRHPFFVRVDGKLAGFVLVHHRSRLSGSDGIHDMAQFFVLRKYRRQRVGERAATAVFDHFPGAWEVRQQSANLAAIAFWRRVIDGYTRGQFSEVIWDDDVWRGPVQLFTV